MHACTICRVVRGRLCGVAPFIFTWNPGLNSGHQVCDRCFTCWVILIDSPVFHCLINISILFHPPPTSLFLCVCMHVFACTCAWCEEPSPACCCFILWGEASVKYRPWHYSQQLVLEIPSLLSQATTPTWHLHGSGDLKSGLSSCLQGKHISPALLSVVKMPKSPFPRILAW